MFGALAIVVAGCPSDDPKPEAGETDPAASGTTGDDAEDPGNSSQGSAGTSSTGASPTTGPVSTTGDDGDPMDDDGSTGGYDGGSTGGFAPMGPADIDLSLVSDLYPSSVHLQTLDFAEDSCEYLDGCLGGTGTRRLLRFPVLLPNVGGDPFHVGSSASEPSRFEYSACEARDVVANAVTYRLLDGDGAEVGTAHSPPLALADEFMEVDYPAQSEYPEGGDDMGISGGWATLRDSARGCQWIDVTDVEPGDYTLEIHFNPDQIFEEDSYDNNLISVAVSVREQDGFEGAVDGWTCLPGYYDADDGCDCGCGIVDPDCEDSLECEYCLAGSCAGQACEEIDPENSAACL
jgi:hypothetical protein